MFALSKKTRIMLAIAALAAMASGSMVSSYPNQKKKPDVAKPTAPEPTPDSFFPLQPGNFWLYKATIEVGNDKGGTAKLNTPKRVQVISTKDTDNQKIVQVKNEDLNGSTQITYVIRGGRIYQFDQYDPPGFEKVAEL